MSKKRRVKADRESREDKKSVKRKGSLETGKSNSGRNSDAVASLGDCGSKGNMDFVAEGFPRHSSLAEDGHHSLPDVVRRGDGMETAARMHRVHEASGSSRERPLEEPARKENCADFDLYNRTKVKPGLDDTKFDSKKLQEIFNNQPTEVTDFLAKIFQGTSPKAQSTSAFVSTSAPSARSQESFDRSLKERESDLLHSGERRRKDSLSLGKESSNSIDMFQLTMPETTTDYETTVMNLLNPDRKEPHRTSALEPPTRRTSEAPVRYPRLNSPAVSQTLGTSSLLSEGSSSSHFLHSPLERESSGSSERLHRREEMNYKVRGRDYPSSEQKTSLKGNIGTSKAPSLRAFETLNQQSFMEFFNSPTTSQALGTSSHVTSEEVLDVLKILDRNGEKMGELRYPIRVLYEKASDLQQCGQGAMKIFSESENITLMKVISKRMYRLSNDGTLSIIQKVIMQEALERLNKLLEQEKERSLYDSTDVKSIARACLRKDVEATLTFIRDALAYEGHSDISQELLKKIYLRVKGEQLNMISGSTGRSMLD